VSCDRYFLQLYFRLVCFQFAFNTTFLRSIEAMRQILYFNYTLPSMLSFCCLIVVLLISRNISVNANTDLSDPSNWDTIFSSRNDDDWRQLWHTEKHRRCYQDLLVHMEWVCDKDIYKLRNKRDIIEGIVRFYYLKPDLLCRTLSFMLTFIMTFALYS